MRKKEEIFISHVLFPWETFAAQAERELRERKNGGARWTESFRKEVRENILRYANTDFFFGGEVRKARGDYEQGYEKLELERGLSTCAVSFQRRTFRGRELSDLGEQIGGRKMDNFERLTQSRGTLGAFLRSLPVLSGPWDDEFHRRRCAFCTRENCDECPNEEERGNPTWWLGLGAEEVET